MIDEACYRARDALDDDTRMEASDCDAMRLRVG